MRRVPRHALGFELVEDSPSVTNDGPLTGMRWTKGRNMVDHTGKARYYPPIHAEPVAVSPRYLSEEEPILIGDLLAAGHTQRSVAA